MTKIINRNLFETVKQQCFKGKTIIVIGPRQVGKSTMLLEVAQTFPNYLFLDGDDPFVRQQLTNPNFQELKQIIGDYKVVYIDEAQRIENIGLTLKMIHDRMKDVQLLVSGSSALDISNEMNEPLTGRKFEYKMFPVSWEEWQRHNDYLTVQQQLEDRLLFGMYPDVLNRVGDEENILRQLLASYLYKDILTLTGIKKPEVLEKLVQALGLQVGNEVSYNELSQLVEVDKNTVSSYIDLLEKAFVVFRLPPYSKNLRNEIKTNKKIYFYDNGIRNAVINNFNPIDMRQDKGALWENFIISERMKFLSYHQNHVNTYFWRTKQQQKIDYLEVKANKISAYEIKWKATAKVKIPPAFAASYKADFQVIDRDNFTNFIVNSK
jgi:predicted AAA+ superfamily ATPase